MHGGLHPDVNLGIRLSAICSRNRYTHDPAPVIAELREAAGDRTDILAAEVGQWIGYYGGDIGVDVLAAALAGMTDLDLAPGIAVGLERRGAGAHGTAGFERG